MGHDDNYDEPAAFEVPSASRPLSPSRGFATGLAIGCGVFVAMVLGGLVLLGVLFVAWFWFGSELSPVSPQPQEAARSRPTRASSDASTEQAEVRRELEEIRRQVAGFEEEYKRRVLERLSDKEHQTIRRSFERGVLEGEDLKSQWGETGDPDGVLRR